jgi:sugar/nucleoside kinase (ribokinase family)
VTQVDATAAGDAFCGALAVKLAEGLALSEALPTKEVEVLLKETNKE